MADSVTDIIARLAFEVTGKDDLITISNELRKQAGVYDQLNQKAEQYEANIAAAKDDIVLQQRLTAELTRVAQARDNVINTIKKTIQNSSSAQTAIKQEISLYDKLTDTIRNAQKAQQAATDPVQFKAFTNQIAAAQKQLKQLQTPDSQGTNSFLSSLLGLGNGGGIGRQLLTGSLIGLGVGGGFGLITRATSALIEYGEEELDVVAKSEKLQKANEELAKSFDGLAEEIIKAGQANLAAFQFENAEKTIDALQREADATKALGVVNGEVYAARQRDLEADNKARDARIAEAKTEETATKSVLAAIKNSAQQANEFIGRPDVIAGSANGNPEANKNVQFTLFQQTLRNLATADLPPDLVNKLTVSLNKSFKDGGDIVKTLNDELRSYEALAQQAEDKTADAVAEKNKAILENEAQTNEARYQLSEQLRIRLTKERQDDLIQRNNVREAELNNVILKTAELLDRESQLRKDNLKIQLDEQNTAVDEEIKLADKNGTLTTAIQQQYNEVKLQNRKKYDLQVQQETIANNERLRQLAIQQTNAATSLQNNQDAKDLIRTTGQIGLAVNQGSQEDFIQYKHRVDEQNQILENEFYAYYKQQYDIAAQANADTTELDERFDTDYRLLKEQEYRNRLDMFQRFTDDYIKIAEKGAQEQKTITDAQTDEVIKELSDKLGFFNEGTYDFKKQVIVIRSTINDLRTNKIPTAQSELEQAKAQFNAVDANNDKIQNDPNASQEQKDASAAALNAASIQVNALDDKVNTLKTNLKETSTKLSQIQRQQIVDQINDYQELVNAAVQAFDAINQARQKSLDVEISIREQQLNQANVLAARGNTSALKQQQELLDKAEQQKELAAKREIEVNEALTVSNSILTIAKAAAEGGAGAAFTIAAAVIALGVGIAEATSLSKKTNGDVGFAEGGYTGDGGKYQYAGPAHKGEFVFNQDKTAKYRPLFEAIHKGYDPVPILKPYEEPAYRQFERNDIKVLAAKLDAVTEAIEGNRTAVHANIDRNGLAIITEQYQKAQWRKFNA